MVQRQTTHAEKHCVCLKMQNGWALTCRRRMSLPRSYSAESIFLCCRSSFQSSDEETFFVGTGMCVIFRCDRVGDHVWNVLQR